MRSHPTRVHLLPLFLLFLLFLIFAGNVAFAAGINHYKYHVKGKSAYAGFSFPDASGCIWTSIFVTAVENVSQSPDFERSFGAYVTASLYVTDRCDGWRTLSSSYGERVLEPGALKFKGNLGGAAVVTDVTLDFWNSGPPHTLEIDLSWTGIGEPWSGRQSETYQDAAYRSTYRFVGSSRDADATGTVILDGAVLPPGTTSRAGLYNSRSGYMEFIQN